MKDEEKTKDQLIEELVQLRQRNAELEKRESEHQKAEKDSAWYQEMLQRMIDQSRTHLVYLDPDFNFVAVNAAYAMTCHRTPKELIGQNHFHFYPHAENEEIFKSVKEMGEPVSFVDKPFVFPDQPERGVTYWDWTLSPVKDESGCVEGFVFSLVETTEHKKAEEALRNSEERFRLFMDNSPVISWMKDEQGRYTYISQTYLKQYLMVPEDIHGKTADDLWPPEIAKKFNENDRAVLSKGQPIQFAEETVGPDGQLIYWLSNKFLFRDIAGKVFIGGIAIDITVRKLLEEDLKKSHDRLEVIVKERTAELSAMNAVLSKEVAEHMQAETVLRDNEEKYRKLFENEMFAICIFDMATLRILDANETHIKLYGYSREELLGGMVATDLSAEVEVSHKSIQDIDSTGAERIPSRNHKKKDGTVFPVEIFAAVHVFQGKRIMYAIVRDISDRKAAENRLILHSEILSKITDGVNVVSASTGRIIYTNPTFDAIFGYESGELIGQSPAVLNVPEAESSPESKASEIMADLQKNGQWHGDLLNRRKDGSTFWTTSTITSHEIMPWGLVWLSIQSDTTERILANKALRKSEALLNQVLESASDAVFAIDRDYRLLINNRRHQQVLVASGGHPLRVGEAVLSPEYPSEIREHWRAMYDRALNGEEMKFDTGYTDKDGVHYFTETILSPLYELNNGSIIGALIIARDITERHRVEEEVREKTEHLNEVNAALRALLRQRETDKKEFEEMVISHVKHLVIPYIESLKRSQLSSNQKSWIESLEKNLSQITSSFVRHITLQELSLSNAELKVAALVRDGKPTKEIAETLMISEKTVFYHRDSIRSKLGLRGKKGGLRTHLLKLK